MNTLNKTCCLLAGLLSVSTLNAQEVDNRASVYGGVVDYVFDRDREQASDYGFLLGGEMPVSERWALGLEYWDLESDSRITPTTTDVNLYRLGANYYFNKREDWQPYFSAGLGKLEMDPNTVISAEDSDSTLDLGVGVKRYFSDNFFVKGDIKMFKAIEASALDFAASVAVGYAFGGNSPAASPSPASPAQGPMDSDGDGVLDNADSCRNTPRGTAVDSRGCELDSDRDGVVDSRDNCPNTSVELAVDRNGCPVLESEMMHQTLEVRFDTDKSDIKAEFDNEIEEFAVFMRTYSNTDAVIEGHTDSTGEASYNQGLSERRANAVMNELINEYNVSRSRLSAVGHGESDPVASNDTVSGRASNRRIDAEVSTEVESEQQR